MSVYTSVEPAQLEQFLKRYPLGRLLALSPIAAGITNTNYYLDTETGQYVLTLYEQHSDDEIEYMLRLQQHLAQQSVLCPSPIPDRRGEYFSMLNQRPAAINQRLPGVIVAEPGAALAARVGFELARFHVAGQTFELARPNPRGIEWVMAAADLLVDVLDQEDRQLIDAALRDYQAIDARGLPRGAIHADLFHDNVLFSGQDLGGIIDFDYACNDSLVLDIAVLLNDWCTDARGRLDHDRLAAVLDAYQQARRLTKSEITVLPLMLRLGALRFWLSRLHDKVFPQSGEMTFIKDPNAMRKILVRHACESGPLERLILPHFMG